LYARVPRDTSYSLVQKYFMWVVSFRHNAQRHIQTDHIMMPVNDHTAWSAIG